MASTRMEKEIMEWIKFIADAIYGTVMTFVFVFLEIFELIVPRKSKSLEGQHVLVCYLLYSIINYNCIQLDIELRLLYYMKPKQWYVIVQGKVYKG